MGLCFFITVSKMAARKIFVLKAWRGIGACLFVAAISAAAMPFAVGAPIVVRALRVRVKLQAAGEQILHGFVGIAVHSAVKGDPRFGERLPCPRSYASAYQCAGIMVFQYTCEGAVPAAVRLGYF
jgi:hypothetical protein